MKYVSNCFVKIIVLEDESDSISMEEMFNQNPQNVEISLTSREKNQKLMEDIGGAWYLKNVKGDYHHWREQKISKKAQEKRDSV